MVTISTLALIGCGTNPQPANSPDPISDTTNYGPATAVPPVLPGIPVVRPFRTNDGQLTPQSSLPCENNKTGPYSRIQTLESKTGPINYLEATLYLPNQPADGTNYPYVYTGGQPKNGTDADVGFQSDTNGMWIPTINVPGFPANVSPFDTNGNAAGFEVGNFIYRIIPNRSVSIKVWISAQDTITFQITALFRKFKITSIQPRQLQDTNTNVQTTVAIVNPNATGWSPSGDGQIFKVMTSIAFPGTGNNYPLMTSPSNTPYGFNGSKWSNIKIGIADKDGKVTTSTPLTSDLIYPTCEAPSDIVNLSGTLPNVSTSLKLRVKGQYARVTADPVSLIASSGDTASGTVTVKNSGPKGSVVTLNFTPPGKGPLNLKLASGATHDIAFAYTCPATANGVIDQSFSIVYSENETASASTPGPPAETAGEIKYSATPDPVQVKLTCVPPPVIAVTPPKQKLFSTVGFPNTASFSVSNGGTPGSTVKVRAYDPSSVKWIPTKSLGGYPPAQPTPYTWANGTITVAPTGEFSAVQGAGSSPSFTVTVTCNQKDSGTTTVYIPIAYPDGTGKSRGTSFEITPVCSPPVNLSFNPNPVALNAVVSALASAPVTISNDGDNNFAVSATTAVDLVGPTSTAAATLRPLAVTGIGGGFGISPSITSIAGHGTKTLTVTRLCPSVPGKYTSSITLTGKDAVTGVPLSFSVPVELTCTSTGSTAPHLANPVASMPDAPVSGTSSGSLNFSNTGGSLTGTCPATEGTLTGSVTITSNDPLASSTVVPVTLACYAPYLVGPSPVTLTGKSGASTDAQTMTVGNKSATRQLVYTPSISGTLSIATLKVSPALSANMTTGANGSQAFSLSADCLADKFGTESVTLNALGANGAGSGSATITVTCKSPKFGPAPAGLSFTANAGETTAAQSFTITNVGNDDLAYSTPPTVTSPAGAVSSLSVTGGTGAIAAGKGQGLSVTATCSNALTAGQTDNFTITIYRADKPSDNVAFPVSVKCVSPIHIVVGSSKIIAFFNGPEAASVTSIAALDSAGNYADVNWTWTTPGVTAGPFFNPTFTNYDVRNPNGFYSGRVGTYMVKASLKSDPTVSAAALITVVNRSFAGLAMGKIDRVDVDWSGSGKINPPDLYPQRCAGTVHYQIATLVDGNHSLTVDNLNLNGTTQLDVLYPNYEIKWDRVIQDGSCPNEIDEVQVQDKLSSLLTEVSNHWKASILPSVAFENPRIMFAGGCKTLWSAWNYSSGCYLVDLVPPPN
jgi:hypothetical protein